MAAVQLLLLIILTLSHHSFTVEYMRSIYTHKLLLWSILQISNMYHKGGGVTIKCKLKNPPAWKEEVQAVSGCLDLSIRSKGMRLD